jgi:N-acetylneuraminic acid mutarotase
MPKARWGLAAGVVNGILYAIGGSSSANYPTRSTKSTVFAYDPVTDTWTEKASMPKARFGLAVAVVNGKLYAVGGNNYRGNMNTVQAYDPATNTWATRASIPVPRTELAASVVNGRIFAVGGCNEKDCRIPSNTLEAYDPETNTWTSKPSMPTARGILTAGVVKGILYAVGGWCQYFTPCDTVEAFSPR